MTEEIKETKTEEKREATFNLDFAPIDDGKIVTPVTEGREEGKLIACDVCGYECADTWKLCPICGKAFSPLDVWDLIASIPKAPTKEQVDELKETKGVDVRLAIYDDDRVYLIRPILRDEWRAFNVKVANIQDAYEREEQMRGFVVDRCVIWPKPNTEEFGNRAGTYSTLYDQIMNISDFFEPHVAVNMVYKL